MHAFIYVLYLLTLIAEVESNFSTVTLTLLIGFAAYFILFEFLQVYLKGLVYFADFWNVFDLLRIVMLFIYISALLTIEDNTNSFIAYFLTALNLFSWFRALSFLRLFTRTRVLIHLIVEVLKDMVPFMIVLLGALTGFTISYRALLSTTNSFGDAF